MSCEVRPTLTLLKEHVPLPASGLLRLHHGLSIVEPDGETDSLVRDAFGAQVRMRFLGVDIDEDRQWILESLSHLGKAGKGIPGPLVCCPALQFYRHEVSFIPTLRKPSLKGDMHNDVRSDAMKTQSLLVFLLDYGIVWQDATRPRRAFSS